jgi:flagellum-specific ATP synthase
MNTTIPAPTAETRAQLPLNQRLAAALATCRDLPPFTLSGRVAGVMGLAIEVEGIAAHLSVGDRLNLAARDRRAMQRQPNGPIARRISAEVVGFRNGHAQAMAFDSLDGVGPGARVEPCRPPALSPSDGWLGRVVDPLGRPMDNKGPLPPGALARPVRSAAPNAATRGRLGPRIDLGVRALNLFATCREGQRLGLFAGSGVGKSTLLSMLARQTECDVAVLALVGERGRELREFIEDDLGEAGLARSVVLCATSDAPPLMRRECAYAALTVAEHFRDEGKRVLLLMDSVTRFCLALREIGLSAGEPPATRGYPPSVFAELPKLLERAGPGPQGADGKAGGSITGLFTVLVEGDDHNEPVADAVRGILDGHVVLDRRIAEAGRYPAIDVLRSLSRTVPGCLQPTEAAAMTEARGLLALAGEMADMVRLGAYRAGTDPATDRALLLAPRIEALLRQAKDEASPIDTAFAQLSAIVATKA